MTDPTAAERCPRCDSPEPKLHPAMQFEGEVQICPDPWHQPTDPTTEPSQHAEYRAKIAAIVDEIGDYPFAAAEEILAVRDAEMEQLREQLKQAQDQFLDTYNGSSRHLDRLGEVQAALRERTDERDAARLQAADEWAEHEETKAHLAQARNTIALKDEELAVMLADFQENDETNLADAQALADENERLRAELAGLRERAVILPEDWRDQLANEVSGMWLDEVTALVNSWRAAPEPATPPTRVNPRKREGYTKGPVD